MKRKKIVLIGAGSAVFTQGLIADLILEPDLGAWEVALVDIDISILNSITKLAKKMVSEKKADIKVSYSADRRKMLPGADVVVTTIAVGGRRAWEKDVQIPRKYGIYQPVGDTTMPGGISRALRMIPVMLRVAKDVNELCPNAWFFNYSNPMTAICTAITKKLGIPVIGLCHGVKHTEQYLARVIGEKNSNINSLGVGLNHLTFLFDLRVNGQNVWPMVYQALKEQSNEESDLDNPFSWSFFKEHGVFPAVLDRHVVEFFPEIFSSGKYYGKTLGEDAFSFEEVIKKGDEIYNNIKEQASGERVLNKKLFHRSEGEHEQLVEILCSLFKDKRKIYSVNIPNNGAVPELPKGIVLEMPAVASGKGFIPLFIDCLPDQLVSILKRRIEVVDLTVEAALTGNQSLFVKALLADKAVKEESTAKKLTDELLEVHKNYLPQF